MLFRSNSSYSIVVKFDFQGNVVWSVKIDPTENQWYNLYSVELCSDGNLIVLGDDMIVTKLDRTNGNIMWQIKFDDNDYSWNNFAGSTTTDGDYIVAAQEDNNDTVLRVFRLSGMDGSKVWDKKIYTSWQGDVGSMYINDDYEAQSIDVDSTHITLSATRYINSYGDNQAVIIRIQIGRAHV